MMKKIAILMLVMVMVLCSCNSGSPQVAEMQSRIAELEQENKDLKTQLDGGGSSASTSKASSVDNGQSSAKPSEDKFKDISLTVTEKNIIQQKYNEFIEIVYVVENNVGKDIKGIEGVMHIQDMFGKSIMNINFDVLEPIPANTSKTFEGTGIEYNQFMDTHQKLYSTSFDSLIFEYEFKTVMFADGSTIS